MRTPKLSDREKRLLARGWSKRKVKLRRTFDKRGSYLGNRIYELTGRIDITAQHIKRIETALGEQKVEQLLAPRPPPPVEDGAFAEDEEGEQKEEISLTQQRRLWYQGYSALSVLKEEKARDMKQLVLVQAAKAVSEKPLPTKATVDAAEAERWNLLDQTSRLRHGCSLLHIGAKAVAEGTKDYAASTMLRSVRQFRTTGGFKRDSRGVHESTAGLTATYCWTG